MRERITSITELSFFHLTIIFIVLVLLSKLDVFSLPINYEFFIFILPILAIPGLLFFRHSKDQGFRGVLPILLIAFLCAILIRLIPQLHSSVPLGYDSGLYKYTIELYNNALPQIPEEELARWIRGMYPQGVFVLSDTTHTVLGTNSMYILNFLLIFTGAFLVFPVYTITKNLFGQRPGVLAAALYAVSYAQFEVLNMCYLKNVFGLLCLLFALYALEKKKYGLMAICFAGLGIYHRPEFLLFALTLVPYSLVHRRKGIVFGVLGAAVLIVPFWILRLESNIPLLSDVIGEAYSNIQDGGGSGGGRFIDLPTYRDISLAYLPFALIGMICLAIRKEWNSVFFFFMINSIIVVFELFFFKRLIIPLDIAVVILAAVGIESSILQKTDRPKIGLIAIVVLVVLVSVVPTIDRAMDVKPLISENQIDAIEWISENTEENAYVLATSFDAPWVLGWSERKVIAPGMFEWNTHNKGQWFRFLGSRDETVAKEFLDVYQEGPVYIYSSQDLRGYINLSKFENASFERVYAEDSVVYRYLGGNQL